MYLYWPRQPGLGQRVAVTIHSADGAVMVPLDMRAPTVAAQGGLAQWNRLGEFEFRPEREAWVEITPVTGDGEAIVDALLLVPAERD